MTEASTILRMIPIGGGFTHADRFEHGWVRECTGEKIGETNTHFDAVKFTRKRHYHPQSGETKFDLHGEWFHLWDSRVQAIAHDRQKENGNG